MKPENVIIEPRENGGDLLKILDFGVAKAPLQTSDGKSLRSSLEASRQIDGAIFFRRCAAGFFGTTLINPDEIGQTAYSFRRVTAGSIRAARAAGMRHAINAVLARVSAATL